jgi:hypothetical protein
MRCALVINFEIAQPEDVAGLLERIDPPSLPWFDGEVRVVVGQDVDDLKVWLDEGDGS